MAPTRPETRPESTLEERIHAVGTALGGAFRELTSSLVAASPGSKGLARSLGLDKVLTSRLLKASRARDPMAVLYHAPGPEPLRRVLRAARKHGADAALLARAGEAVEDFEHLIRHEAGDRSTLGAIISAWLPEARHEFEIRRKQAAFKAISELKGCWAETDLSAVFLHPSANGTHIDVVWLVGLLGLRRLRPDARVKFVSQRIVPDDAPRRPVSLDGEPYEALANVRLDEFCYAPPATLEPHSFGGVVHYTLAGRAYGPKSPVDLVFAEVNLAEMPRYAQPGRKGYVFSDVPVPVKNLAFDVFVHEDVYPGREPELLLYDTAVSGIADVNDRACDVDRLDLAESVQPLGSGTGAVRIAEVPNYVEMVRHVYAKMGWDEARFRGWRCRVEYPLYGSQFVLAFDPPAPPSD